MHSEVFSIEEPSGNEAARKRTPEGNVHRLVLGERSVILVGTAHVSARSAELVAQIIDEERPDAVCVELCQMRYESILRYGMNREMNLLDLIGMRKGHFLTWLSLWYFQKKVGERLGIKPGAEIVKAIEAAKAAGASVYPIDRDMRVTLDRAWKLTSLKTKMALAVQLALSLGSVKELREEDIESLKREDLIERSVDELGKSLPVLRQVILDERDMHMAEKIAAIEGQKIVVIVGAAHVPGIMRHLSSVGLSEIERAGSLEAA